MTGSTREHARDHARDPGREPIFVLGVPRSGTTLLRTILDSHPSIACGPETPWLAEHHPRTVMGLWRFLVDDAYGYCASYGMPRAAATDAARAMVESLLGAYARRKGKRRWAEKTPDNALFVPFLAELFPEASFIHLTRDGLDTAVSTSIIPERRKGISTWHEENLVLAPGLSVKNTPFAAMLKWRHWDATIERDLVSSGISRVHRLRYEDLVGNPEPTVRALCEFLGESFEPSMLDYAAREHDYPPWEWGSADVSGHAGIRADRVGRWREKLPPVDIEILAPLAAESTPASTSSIEPRVALASVHELESPRFRRFMEWCNAFAAPLGLRTFTNWSKVWEYPWLWFHAIERAVSQHARPRREPGPLRLVDLGSELSPMPWILALLGAKVTLIETDPQFVPLWTTLRDGLRVDVDWHIVSSERLPLPDAAADVITSYSVIEHQPDKPAAIAEATRVLRPGGLFCLSFDICEPAMGMAFPAWNGQALTMREFEDLLWLRPEFGSPSRPTWNTSDIPAFLDWHRQSAPHHTYVTGAAVLVKRP